LPLWATSRGFDFARVCTPACGRNDRQARTAAEEEGTTDDPAEMPGASTAGPPMLLPGVKLSMSPTDLRPMKQTWLQRFDGERWRLFGDVVDVTK
jgi:branched-chain amino acid transport system substrate-binding protein